MFLFMNEIGNRHGRLVALSLQRAEKRNGEIYRYWNCLCDCGKMVVRGTASLRDKKHTSSCGCFLSESTSRKNKVHGFGARKKRTAEYQIWMGIRSRVNNPNHKNSKEYKERGIAICPRWNSFENFISDMGNKPTPKHTIERINNAGNYDPENCRWATRSEQARNRRSNVMLTYKGETLCVIEWCERIGIEFCTLISRVSRGWTDERAITTPVRFVTKK